MAMPWLYSLQPGMENVTRPIARIFCVCFSPRMMETLRPEVCVCVHVFV